MILPGFLGSKYTGAKLSAAFDEVVTSNDVALLDSAFSEEVISDESVQLDLSYMELAVSEGKVALDLSYMELATPASIITTGLMSVDASGLGFSHVFGDLFTDGTHVDAANSLGENVLSAGVAPVAYQNLSTSYANAGGSGDRRSTVLLTSSLLPYAAPYDISAIMDNNGSTFGAFTFGGSAAGQYIRFDFTEAKTVTEITFSIYTNNTHGTWKWQYSNDAVTWTDCSATFTMGSTPQVYTMTTTTGARYYQVVGISGTINNYFWITDVTFKIAAATFDNMDLISTELFTNSPSYGRLHLSTPHLSATLNTDIMAYLSKDGGVTWSQGTLSSLETIFIDGTLHRHLATNIINLTGQSGSSVKYKVEVRNKYQHIRSVAVLCTTL